MEKYYRVYLDQYKREKEFDKIHCPYCNSVEIYELFPDKLWRCRKCHSDIKKIN